MAIKFANLSGALKSILHGPYPDLGQVFWVVDTNYRTAAQGWTQADGTGPLDIYKEFAPGHVFYGAGSGTHAPSSAYATDRAAIQAAIDACVDFRGDTVALSPGNFSLASVLAVNASNMRLVGAPSRSFRTSRTIVTDAIGAGIPVTVDDVEIAFLGLIPLTATSTVTVNAGDRAFIHNVYWDATGVAASTLTQGIEFLTTDSDDVEVAQCAFRADGAQGPGIDFDFTSAAYAHDLFFFGDSGTWANLMETTANTNGALVDLVHVNGGVNGTITNVFLGAANVNKQLLATRIYMNGSVITSIESTYGTTTDIDIAECYTSGDSASQGGALTVLA